MNPKMVRNYMGNDAFYLNCSGIFFVLPCIESYQKVDLRTITLGVPPQEVEKKISHMVFQKHL